MSVLGRVRIRDVALALAATTADLALFSTLGSALPSGSAAAVLGSAAIGALLIVVRDRAPLLVLGALIVQALGTAAFIRACDAALGYRPCCCNKHVLRSESGNRAQVKGSRTRSVVGMIKTVSLRLAAIATFLAACFAATVVNAPVASADVTFTRGAVTVNCAYLSCSYYVSRSATQELNSRIGELAGTGAGVGTIVCGTAGVVGTPLAGVLCGGLVAINGALITDSVKQAASKSEHPPNGACFKINVRHGGGQPLYSTNNGKHCKN